MWLRRFIMFMLRRNLGLKLGQHFYFANQKRKAFYYFTKEAVIRSEDGVNVPAGISVNWLLSDECKRMLKII